MCGIVGLWLKAPQPSGALRERVERATASLRHRGPDAGRVEVLGDARSSVALGHRRLAIVDLSPEGVQPMASASGRYVVVFNGEVYNHDALRAELEREGRAPAWRGRSDTEVLLAAVEAWGLERTIDRAVGMFAIGLWDRVEERLHLVRDRLGIKPLFVASLPDGLAFASEVRAFETDPSFDRALDPAAVEDVLRVGYVGAGRSIYRAVRPLAPGTHLVFARPDASEARRRVFWDVAEVVRAGRERPFAGDESEAQGELERVLRDAVRLRMLADVPLGAFLSGGIDSSLVTALMQAQSERPVRTYSIGNERAAYDESAHAAEVARHLGTAHTAFRVSAEQALAVVPRLATMYDEPFADSSQIPTFLVCELARREVTVALSGDGGDEVFGGYNRHVFAPPIWRLAGAIPAPLRAAAAGLALAPSEERWDGVFERTLGGRLRTPGAKVHKLARALRARSEADFYDQLRSLWPPESLPLRPPESLPLHGASSAASSRFAVQAPRFAERMMASDLVDYLPGDILTKVDRASMAVALEARVPLLDHRVVELAWRLPHAMKIRGRTGKHLLRALLRRFVPPALFERPKMGFGVPLGEWLRGPLRPWVEQTLARPAESLGLDLARVRATWAQHQARGGLEHRLWPVLMLSAWAEARGVG